MSDDQTQNIKTEQLMWTKKTTLPMEARQNECNRKQNPKELKMDGKNERKR